MKCCWKLENTEKAVEHSFVFVFFFNYLCAQATIFRQMLMIAKIKL